MSNQPTQSIDIQSNYLWFLTLTYTMVLVFANWFAVRLIDVFGFVGTAGLLVFPFTFLLADLITEVYGYKYARRAIWCGFIFNLLFIVLGQIVVHLPSPNFPTNNAMFDAVLATNVRIVVASAISYLTSEPINSLILAKLKIRLDGRFMGTRFMFSTMIAAAIDSIFFSAVAFYGTMSNANLMTLIATMWVVKMVIEAAGLPISIALAKKLKRIERIDIYDNDTKFNIFTLDTSYAGANNEFKA